MPIIGARRLEHLTANLAGLEVTLDAEPARPAGRGLGADAELPGGAATVTSRAMLQFAGATVDGEASAVYPPLLQSDVRY